MSRRGFLGMLGAAGLACVAGLGLTGCDDGGSAAPAVDYNSMSLDDLIAQAKEEGQINSVGMPDTWANWVETWADLNSEYGLQHADQDMSSAEEIAMFKQEGTDGTKDIGDVGQQWGPTAESEGVTLKYKTSYWDEIPDWAKDDDGDWVVGYYGSMALISNDDQVSPAPTSISELLDGDYKVSVGDITSAANAQHAVLAIAYAMGGSIDDLQPAYDFITQLAQAGRLDVSDVSVARLESGEIAVGFNWDYNALNYRAQIVENNPDAKFSVCIPSDGSVQSGYATIINANAPHPAAACLAREFILSDEGQINLARGYATPIRSSVELPEDVKALRLPDEQYGDQVQSIDYGKWTDVTNELVTWYQENIIPILG
ncbi:extracellular solute-binding protein [Olsenella profusa]|uniref:Extracellular solute-binding protein n=2 Tax=Olsenella profusa TaxID=138595 RepID=A0ABS2EZ56_9ACTN|nr:extracellular solute-binding protein [Olsenella profusa]MBM6774006.1 extracellular solute-binding protein [Olsenella profusa]